MDKELLIEKYNNIKDLFRQYNELYELLDLMGIKYQRTSCIKCRKDYLNIIGEELGLIESAAEVSSFNNYKYLKKRTFLWYKDGKVVKINSKTPKEEIEQFIKTHKGFYKIDN